MVIIYRSILKPVTCEPYVVFLALTLIRNELIVNRVGPFSSGSLANSKLALFKNSV